VIAEFWWHLFPVAVLTSSTRERIYAERILDERLIGYNPDTLTIVAREMLWE